MHHIGRRRRIAAKPRRVVSVPARSSILDAARMMRRHRIGCLVVTDESGKLAGIISERDLVNWLAGRPESPADAAVKDIMTANVACCPPGTSMSRAAEMMTAREIRHLPVVEAGTPMQVISMRDVMAEQSARDQAMRAAAEQVAMLSACLKCLDFDETLDMVAGEVPQLFRAQRGVLWFPTGPGGQATGPLICRNNCGCPQRQLRQLGSQLEAAGESGIIRRQGPAACAKRGCPPPATMLRLHVAGFGPAASAKPQGLCGYLCMCGLSPAGAFWNELVSYKGSLVQEILNANLTTAALFQEMRRRSMTDALTGVGTRRLCTERLEAECLRANRYRRGFCVALVDVDHFKSINSELGHGAGDRFLAEVGRCMMCQKRSSDVLARYGGDEFVLLMPETDLAEAVAALDRIRLSVANIRTSDNITLTVSCGVADRPGRMQQSPAELLNRADAALYEAKRSGRNRTCPWKEDHNGFGNGGHLDQSKLAELQQRITEMSARSKEMFVQSIWGLVRALEARDPYTKDHSENVMRFAVGIAQALGLGSEEVAVIRRAAMIHDIGKIGVPDSILRKPAALTKAQRRIMERHPLIAVRILDQMRFLEREMPAVRHHHERWDGQGYPDGLKGPAIPFMARVLAVADALDAITSDRVYRKARSLDQARAIVTAAAGSQFDPYVVDGMLKWIDSVSDGPHDQAEVTTQDLLGAQESALAGT